MPDQLLRPGRVGEDVSAVEAVDLGRVGEGGAGAGEDVSPGVEENLIPKIDHRQFGVL